MWIYQYQTMLSALYPDSSASADGYFDEATEHATRSLQSDFGLNPSGTGGRRDLGRPARAGLPPLQLVTPPRKDRS